MTEAGGASDPRPGLGAALDQTQRQIDATKPDDFGRSTPCAEYDVKTLLAHLFAVLRTLAVVGNGGDMTQVGDPADDRTDDWARRSAVPAPTSIGFGRRIRRQTRATTCRGAP
jgi:uncharacterized protein (TIGR03083 family)